MTRGLVFLVDDERHVRAAAEQALDLAGYEVQTFEEAQPALERLDPDWAGVVVSDIRMPNLDGMAFLDRVVEIDGELPMVLVTGHGDISMAVEAMRKGAYDFIEKPFASDHLIEVVGRATEKRRLTLENRALRRELTSYEGIGPRLVGRTTIMQRVRQRLLAIAESDADCLIQGATGAGKEVAARFVHQTSRRKDGPFVALNCAALPEELIESELFGHEAGAFTGAAKRRVGKFEHAHHGTIFLDEIESMPRSMQVKILRVLQERVVEPLGANQTVPVDFRVVAATKVDLREAADNGRFRADLYYRLNVATVELPALRERREDIPLLFQHFLLAAAARYEREVPSLEPELAAELKARDWPGNVRELRNHAERWLLFGDQAPLGGEPAQGLTEQVARFERSLIAQALRQSCGSVTDAASRLGVPRKTLADKLLRYGIERERFA